jgi:hypothetical protein
MCDVEVEAVEGALKGNIAHPRALLQRFNYSLLHLAEWASHPEAQRYRG